MDMGNFMGGGMGGFPMPAFNSSNGHMGNVIYVNGLEGAKAHQLNAGQSAILLDENVDAFYLKTVDASSKPTYKRYEFAEVSAEPAQEQYVTKQEFKQLLDKLGEKIDE